MKRKFGYAALALTLAAGGALLLSVSTRWSLFPHASALGFLYGVPFSFDPEIGYVAALHGFQITLSCSGAKLYVSAFLLLAFGFPARRARGLFGYAACSLVGAVALSILRIAMSMPFAQMARGALYHTLISLATHFGALTLLYGIMKYRYREESTHERSI